MDNPVSNIDMQSAVYKEMHPDLFRIFCSLHWDAITPGSDSNIADHILTYFRKDLAIEHPCEQCWANECNLVEMVEEEGCLYCPECDPISERLGPQYTGEDYE